MHHVPQPLLLSLVNTVGNDPNSDAWATASQLLLLGVQWQEADPLLLATALLCHATTVERRLLEGAARGLGGEGASAEDGGAVGGCVEPAGVSSMYEVAARLCANEAVRRGHWALREGNKGGPLRLLLALEWWALGLQLRCALQPPCPALFAAALPGGDADAGPLHDRQPLSVCIDGGVAQRCRTMSPVRQRSKKSKKKHRKRRRASSESEEHIQQHVVRWEYTPPGLNQGVVLDGKALQTAVQQQALLAWVQWVAANEQRD